MRADLCVYVSVYLSTQPLRLRGFFRADQGSPRLCCFFFAQSVVVQISVINVTTFKRKKR